MKIGNQIHDDGKDGKEKKKGREGGKGSEPSWNRNLR